MDKFNIIRDRRTARLKHFAGQVYDDKSNFYLRDFLDKGFTEAVFVANYGTDDDCVGLDGSVYNIEDLLTYDQPLFSTSHINCQCKFVPYEASREPSDEDLTDIELGEDFMDEGFEDEELEAA